MKHDEAFFHGLNGLDLYYQFWQADMEPRAIIALVHGVAEHSGRYMNVVNPLTSSGYTVYGYDHRGHGRSPGQRVFINHWEEYREDLKAFLELVGNHEPGKSVFLYGHSMGALIALDYLLHYPQGLRGAILSTPTIEETISKPYMVPLARALSGIWPRFSMKTGMDTKVLSRDPEVGKTYRTDPLITRQATARWFSELLDTISWVKSHAAEICLPILLIHGEVDQLNSVQGTNDLFEAMTYPDKTLRIYPGGYHELHNDIDHKRVVADIKEWLDQHL